MTVSHFAAEEVKISNLHTVKQPGKGRAENHSLVCLHLNPIPFHYNMVATKVQNFKMKITSLDVPLVTNPKWCACTHGYTCAQKVRLLFGIVWLYSAALKQTFHTPCLPLHPTSISWLLTCYRYPQNMLMQPAFLQDVEHIIISGQVLSNSSHSNSNCTSKDSKMKSLRIHYPRSQSSSSL